MSTCYVSAPYGVKDGIDFDNIYRKLIMPAIERSELTCSRGDERRIGIAHKAVFSCLLESELMIADITIHNPNVVYELGLRHASHAQGTILIKGMGGDEIPWNLKMLWVVYYDIEKPEKSIDDLVEAISYELSVTEPTSPLHVLLPEILNPMAEKVDIESNSIKMAAQKSTEVVNLFMITPFAEEYKKVEDAVRKFFECPPYFFKVQLARDYTYKGTLLDNVRAHINRADGFIADITELNPNVMLELGAALLPGDGRPIFSLRGHDAKEEVPADLKSELYIPYHSTVDKVEEIEAALRNTLEKEGRPINDYLVTLQKNRQQKALTKTLLQQLTQRLNSDEIKQILKRFTTIESLLDQANDEIARLTGIKEYTIAAIDAELHELID